MTLNFPSDTSQPYIDPSSGLKYVFNGAVGAWETALQPPVVVSDSAPDLNIPGFLWWDSVGGSLYVRYNDGVSEQWVEAVPSAIAKQVLFLLLHLFLQPVVTSGGTLLRGSFISSRRMYGKT